MEIKEIPKVIFTEFSLFGENKCTVLAARGDEFLICELDPTKAGFNGAIGLHESEHFSAFIIWPIVPPENPENNTFFGHIATLKIEVGLDKKDARVRFGNGLSGISLGDQGMKLAVKVVQRAIELAATAI